MRTKGLFFVAALLLGSDAVAQQRPAAAPPPATTLVGTVMTWKLPGDGWKPYPSGDISRLGVEIDECVQNERLRATICMKALDARSVGGPIGALNRLFEKFSVDPEDRPPVVLKRTSASFAFHLGAGIVADAMDIKVVADLAPNRKGKVVMVMGAWGTSEFSTEQFDAIAQGSRLR